MKLLAGETVLQAKDVAEAPTQKDRPVFKETFTGFRDEEHFYIDYIFVRIGTGMRVLDTAVLSGDGTELGSKKRDPLSDHRPVWAQFLM